MKNIILSLFTAGFLILSLSLSGQSKKEYRVKIDLLEAQLTQMRDKILSLQAAHKHLEKQLKVSRDSLKEQQKEERQFNVEDSLQKLLEENIKLKEELHKERLSSADRKLPAQLKQKEYIVTNASQRKLLAQKHALHYLSNCLRFNNPQRMFTEEILLEYEVHPISDEVEGFLRKRYVPEIGRDQYNYQKLRGKFKCGDEFNELHITEIDGNSVDIRIKFGVNRDLYNHILGEEEDLKSIATLYGKIDQFSIEHCRKI